MATTTRQTVSRGAPRPAARKPVSSPTNKSAKRRGQTDIPPFVIFEYGISGVGKTSKWANLPNVGFLHDSQEQGINTLVRFGRVPKPAWVHEAKDWDDTIDVLADVANRKFDIDFLVVDSCTGFQKYCFMHHARENFDGDFSKEGFFAYNKGPVQASTTDWPDFLEALQNVNKSGIGVVLLAHAEVKNFKNPSGPDYDTYTPVLQKDIWSVTHRWAEAVLFYNIQVEVGKLEKGSLRKKAVSERRIICTEPAGAYAAKNWWGLPGIISAGESAEEAYTEFMHEYQKAAARGA